MAYVVCVAQDGGGVAHRIAISNTENVQRKKKKRQKGPICSAMAGRSDGRAGKCQSMHGPNEFALFLQVADKLENALWRGDRCEIHLISVVRNFTGQYCQQPVIESSPAWLAISIGRLVRLLDWFLFSVCLYAAVFIGVPCESAIMRAGFSLHIAVFLLAPAFPHQMHSTIYIYCSDRVVFGVSYFCRFYFLGFPFVSCKCALGRLLRHVRMNANAVHIYRKACAVFPATAFERYNAGKWHAICCRQIKLVGFVSRLCDDWRCATQAKPKLQQIIIEHVVRGRQATASEIESKHKIKTIKEAKTFASLRCEIYQWLISWWPNQCRNHNDWQKMSANKYCQG